MSYQVLARKYRPSRFADMVGQEPVVRTLTNALGSGRVHHAYVFSGIRGIGKTTSARLLARALNCAAGPTAEPCGTCPACVEISEGRSIDAIEIDAASNRGIDEVKALIQSAQYSPSRDRHKIFIVDEFHMLTREAFNALLKTLEEPPPRVVFILATTELEKVPATILSRCLLLPFRPVSALQLKDHLLDIAARENVTLDPGAAELIARKAGGSIRDAQSTLDRVIALAGETVTRDAAAEVLGLTDAVVLRGALRAMLEGRAADALAVVADVCATGADLHAFLDELLAEARSALLARIVPNPADMLGLPESSIADLRSIAALASEDDLRRVVDRLIDAGPRLRAAPEPRFVVEALVVRLAHLTRLEPLAEIVRRLDAGGGDASSGGGQAERPRPQVEARPPAPARAEAPPEPRPAPKAAPTADMAAPSAPPDRSTSSTWRDRLASGASAPEGDMPDDDALPVVTARVATAAPVARVATPPVEIFRSGLPARLRGHVEHAVVRTQGEGVAILLPPDMEPVREHVEQGRFHLMAAAAEAFGRPVPVAVSCEPDLVTAEAQPGDLEGADLAARRLIARAERSSLVQGVVSRFAGRIAGVMPPDARRPRPDRD